MELQAEDTIVFIVFGQNGEHSIVESGTIPRNTWTHVVGVWDGLDVRLYVNGAQVLGVTEAPTSFTMLDTFGLVGIGDTLSGATHGSLDFAGLLDEMYVFDRGLTDTEILDLYSGAVR